MRSPVCSTCRMYASSHCAKKGQSFLPGNVTASKWDRLKAMLHTASKSASVTCAPLGYEDETGFHFGMEMDLEPDFAPTTPDPGDSGIPAAAWQSRLSLPL